MVEKKPYQPKGLFQRILEEHSNWLFAQGYHERGLGNREEPGKLLQRVQETFQEAIIKTLWTYRIEEFQIGTRGVFGPKKDPVDFTFHYRYDPHRTRLELTKLSAQLYDHTIEHFISGNTRRELPTAYAAYTQLQTVITEEVLQRLKEEGASAKEQNKIRQAGRKR